MKPLPVAPLAFEDVAVWVFLRLRRVDGARHARWKGNPAADRRDAELMLQARQHPQKILFGPVTDPPWKWVRMRGGVSFGDFLRDSGVTFI